MLCHLLSLRGEQGLLPDKRIVLAQAQHADHAVQVVLADVALRSIGAGARRVPADAHFVHCMHILCIRVSAQAAETHVEPCACTAHDHDDADMTAPLAVAPSTANSSTGPPSLPTGATVFLSRRNMRCPEPAFNEQVH